MKMAPKLEWWGRGNRKGTPVVVKMEKPNKWSMLELEYPSHEDFHSCEKSRNKNARQLTWVLLLKAHRAAGCLTSLGSALIALGNAVRCRIAKAPSTQRAESSMLHWCVKLLAWISLLFLLIILTVGFWWMSGRLFGTLQLDWALVRAEYLAPALQFLANVCIVLFFIQSLDRLVLCLGCFWIRCKKIRPQAVTDVEYGFFFPMVLVQIPMCNEKEVYQQSIAAVCNLDWPKMNILIQILDDSDDPITQHLIKEEVHKWQQLGARIVYRHRLNRQGYKAGNLNSAMNCSYVKNYEFVAIFDADFQPLPDFLRKTIPHFKDNDELGLVQARWSFVNKEENLLTRLQNINLAFHFEVEQQVNSVFLNFFGFNGTAGVWRIKALEDSGGWLERTTVEDMDIAVRAHLHGWKFIFLNDVEISLGKKFNLIFLFFLLRKLILPFYSFTLFCIILPMTMFVPEAKLHALVVCYIPATMSFLNILPTPKSFPFIVPYLLFENTMSVTKFNAMLSGLFQLGSAYEWVVTKKSGRSSKGDLVALVEKQGQTIGHQRGVSAPQPETEAGSKVEERKKKKKMEKKKHNRVYMKELSLAFLLLTAATRSLLSAQGIHFYFLLFQGISFLLVGLDLIGEQVE